MWKRVVNLGLMVLLLATGASRGSESADADIERLIQQLGSKSFRERDSASRLLEAKAEAAFFALRKTPKPADLEMSRRLTQLAARMEARLSEPVCRIHLDAGYIPAALSPDGKLVLTRQAHAVRLLDADSGKPLKRFDGHSASVAALTFLPDDRRFLSGSNDKTLRLWDGETGKELTRLEGHRNTIFHIATSGDGRLVWTAAADKTIRVWDLETRKQLAEFVAQEQWGDIAVFRNGKQALAGNRDHCVHLLDLDTRTTVRRLQGHSGAVHSVCLSADGRRAVSGANDGAVILWDLETRRATQRLTGHSDAVLCVAINAAGNRVLSAGWDGTVRYWDVASGEALTLKEHRTFVVRVALQSDGRRGLSAGAEGKVCVWALPR